MSLISPFVKPELVRQGEVGATEARARSQTWDNPDELWTTNAPPLLVPLGARSN